VHRKAAKIFVKANSSLLCDSLPISAKDIDKWLRDNGWKRAKAKAVTRHRNAILKLLDRTPFRTLIYAHAKKYPESSVPYKVRPRGRRTLTESAWCTQKAASIYSLIVFLSVSDAMG
jgi:hypothetical protein